MGLQEESVVVRIPLHVCIDGCLRWLSCTVWPIVIRQVIAAGTASDNSPAAPDRSASSASNSHSNGPVLGFSSTLSQVTFGFGPIQQTQLGYHSLMGQLFFFPVWCGLNVDCRADFLQVSLSPLVLSESLVRLSFPAVSPPPRFHPDEHHVDYSVQGTASSAVTPNSSCELPASPTRTHGFLLYLLLAL